MSRCDFRDYIFWKRSLEVGEKTHAGELADVFRLFDARLSKLEAEAAKPKAEPAPEQGWSGHDSDCAVHNAPALPPGPCNCGDLVRERFDAEVVQCAIDKNVWRVEAFDIKEGDCFVTLFQGPGARARATEYAREKYHAIKSAAPETREPGWYPVWCGLLVPNLWRWTGHRWESSDGRTTLHGESFAPDQIGPLIPPRRIPEPSE